MNLSCFCFFFDSTRSTEALLMMAVMERAPRRARGSSSGSNFTSELLNSGSMLSPDRLRRIDAERSAEVLGRRRRRREGEEKVEGEKTWWRARLPKEETTPFRI